MSLKSLTTIHTISVYRPTTTSGTSMGPSRSYALVTSTLKCRVVPPDPTEENKHSQRGVKGVWRVYFSADPSIQEKDVILFGSTYLDVQGTRNASNLSRLWIALATENTTDHLSRHISGA